MDEKLILDVFSFCESMIQEECKIFQDTLIFVDSFIDIYNKEKEKLPYHINVIDELRADENAHSRILAQLLRYEKDKQYPFLESFLNKVCNFNVNIEKPEVKKVDSCGRIDIPIFDKSYAVIIESKVTDALDQNREDGGQLARYIETVKNNCNKKLEEIFIVYTPRYSRVPVDECWENGEGDSYKKEFKDRFCSLSYRDKIYPWLKEEILPFVLNNKNDIYLRSAIEQYIDHLEGEEMFNLRNKEMAMELQKFIKKHLELDGNHDDDLEKVLAKKDALYKVTSELEKTENEIRKKIQLSEWEERLRQDYPEYDILRREDNTVGVKVPDYRLYVRLSADENGYCQIEDIDLPKNKSKITLPDELKKEIQEILNDRNNNDYNIWKYLKGNFQEGYPLLQKVVNRIQEYQKRNTQQN